MSSIFPVETKVSNACTESDINYYINACAIMRCIGFVASSFKKQNRNGYIPQVECHTVARIIKLLIPDLKLHNGCVSGILYDSDTPHLIKMRHSWLSTPSGTIIDPHPSGILSLQIVLIVPNSNTINDAFGHSLYREEFDVLNEFDYREAWKNARGIVRLFKNRKFNTPEIREFAEEMVTLIKRKPLAQ